MDWSDNCATRAAAACGVDLSELGGWPGSWREAAALYRRLGVRTLEDVVSLFLGPPLASPRRARRGDIVMVDGNLGICRGEVAECLGATVPMRRASKAWRAG